MTDLQTALRNIGWVEMSKRVNRNQVQAKSPVQDWPYGTKQDILDCFKNVTKCNRSKKLAYCIAR